MLLFVRLFNYVTVFNETQHRVYFFKYVNNDRWIRQKYLFEFAVKFLFA